MSFPPVKFPENEHIVGVACQFPCPPDLLKENWEGKPVYPDWITVSLPAPYRHGHVLHTTNIMAMRNVLNRQGFLTSTGRYVSREEAWKIADFQGQIKRVTGGEGTLYSEDLW